MQPDQRIGNTTLVDQSYWDRSYADMAPTVAPPGDVVRTWLETQIPRPTGEQHVLEVGCFPGRYLGVLGQLGYTVHGIDLTPAVRRMKPGLDALGLRTGDFHEADFLSFEPGRRYDVVCSFGFIEHFQDWAAVLRKHAALVAPGGRIIIETPNFRGAVQQLFHRWLDAENLKRHNLAAMVPQAWADVLRSEGFTVERAGYFGPFDFWHDSGGSGLVRRVGFGLLRLISPLLKHLPEGSATWSPYAGLIAHKR